MMCESCLAARATRRETKAAPFNWSGFLLEMFSEYYRESLIALVMSDLLTDELLNKHEHRTDSQIA